MPKISQDVFSKMQTGKPFASYKKTVLGKVDVKVLNSFSKEPEELLLVGNPRTNDENTIIDVWDEMEDVFFRRNNKNHLNSGFLVPFERPTDEVIEPSPNEITDEEIIKLLNSPFLSLQSRINKFDSVAPVFRFIEIAKELDKSDKIIKFLEGRMAELQTLEYGEI